MDNIEFRPIADIHCDLPSKFGLPRQGGAVPSLTGRVIFRNEFRNPDAVKGLEGFSRIWLLWCFSESMRDDWNATVRPPLLGGNERVGVFATRSPFRPNPIAMTSVSLDRIEYTEHDGPVLYVSGIDMCDGTPVFDIKPYIPKWDSHPEEHAGFVRDKKLLEVDIPEELLDEFPEEKRETLIALLSQDPRPSYQNDPQRIYGFTFAGREVHFRVDGDRLTAVDVMSSGM